MLRYLVSLALIPSGIGNEGESWQETWVSFHRKKKLSLELEILQLLGFTPVDIIYLCFSWLHSSCLTLTDYYLNCTSVVFHELLISLGLAPGCSVFTLFASFFLQSLNIFKFVSGKHSQTILSISLYLPPYSSHFCLNKGFNSYLLSKQWQWTPWNSWFLNLTNPFSSLSLFFFLWQPNLLTTFSFPLVVSLFLPFPSLFPVPFPVSLMSFIRLPAANNPGHPHSLAFHFYSFDMFNYLIHFHAFTMSHILMTPNFPLKFQT